MIKLLEISTQTEISKMRRENNRWLGWNTDYKHLSKDTHFRWKIKRHDLWVRPAASCMFACGIRSQGFDTLSCQESAKIPHPPPPSTLHLFCAPSRVRACWIWKDRGQSLHNPLDHFHVLLTSQKQYKAG